MSLSPTLMHAILAMDAYNQGHNPRIKHNATKIGNATLIPREIIINDDEYGIWQNTSFYAVAYNYGGETVISYRGTDNFGLSADPVSGSSDPLNSWGTAK